MKKTALLVLIINMFLLMSVDVLNEYISMKERTQSIESTVRNSMNSAINTVLSSEEFFSSTSSYSSRSGTNARVSVWNGSGFTVGNMYLISEYMSAHGGAIPTQSVYNSWVSRFPDIEGHVYNMLYGDLSTRRPTAKLKEFFDNVGRFCESTMRTRNISSMRFEEKTFPTLSRMGLRLDSIWNESICGYSLGVNNQFQSPVNTGIDGSRYYLTPASLGVTYLDEELLRNTMRCMLDTQIRCNKVTNTTDAEFGSADGTIPTQVYESGVSGAYAEHRNGAGHTIVNDGYVEYFMDTLDVQVTYYVVDWWDNANWEIVSYVEGAPSAISGVSPTSLPSWLKYRSTQSHSGSNYYVVVAKVDVSIELSIPHKSWVLQWNRHRTTAGRPTEYYGVLGIDAGGTLTAGDTGLVYRYTTFCAVTE